MTTDRSPRFPPASARGADGRAAGAPEGDAAGAGRWADDWLAEQHRLLELEDGFRD